MFHHRLIGCTSVLVVGLLYLSCGGGKAPEQGAAEDVFKKQTVLWQALADGLSTAENCDARARALSQWADTHKVELVALGQAAGNFTSAELGEALKRQRDKLSNLQITIATSAQKCSKHPGMVDALAKLQSQLAL